MNIFRILSSGKHNIREEFVSAFLAYLISPKMDHGLGGAFLATLLAEVGEKIGATEIVDLTGLLKHRLWEDLFQDPVGQVVVELEFPYVSGGSTCFIDVVVRLGEWFVLIENKILPQSKTLDQLTSQYQGFLQTLADRGELDRSRVLVLYLVPADGSEEEWSVSPGFYQEVGKVALRGEDRKALVTWQPVRGTEDEPVSVVGVIRKILAQEGRGMMAPVSVEMRQMLLSFVDFSLGQFQGYHYEATVGTSAPKDRRRVSEILALEGDYYVGVQYGKGGLVGAAWKNPAFLETKQTLAEEQRGWQYLTLSDFKRLTRWALDPEGQSLAGMEWNGKPFTTENLYRVARWGKSELYVGIKGGKGALEAMSPKELEERVLEIRSEKCSSQWIPSEAFCEIVEGKGLGAA